MTTHFAASLSLATLVGSGIAGGATGVGISHLIADASGSPPPDWLALLLGPAGTIVACVLGLRWLSVRWEKSEVKLEAQDKQREDMVKSLTEALTKNTLVIEQVAAAKDRTEEIASSALRVTARVGTNLEALANELSKRPCGMAFIKPTSVADRDPTT